MTSKEKFPHKDIENPDGLTKKDLDEVAGGQTEPTEGSAPKKAYSTGDEADVKEPIRDDTLSEKELKKYAGGVSEPTEGSAPKKAYSTGDEEDLKEPISDVISDKDLKKYAGGVKGPTEEPPQKEGSKGDVISKQEWIDQQG